MLLGAARGPNHAAVGSLLRAACERGGGGGCHASPRACTTRPHPVPVQGALVANYPWDGTPDETTRYEACPDDDTFRHLAALYASTHQTMALANNTVGCRAEPALAELQAGSCT